MVELIYKGKGFLGYKEDDKRMVFVKELPPFDYLVEYKGNEMIVRKHEVMPKGE